MPIVDLLSLGDDTAAQLEECDVCIIGSGAAGSTIACEFSASKLNVVLLESGRKIRLPEADALNAVETVGKEREPDQWAERNRILGGSSHDWSRRCAAFDAIDFETRPWVPGSAWPFGLETLAPYLERPAADFGLAMDVGFDDRGLWKLAGKRTRQTADRVYPKSEYFFARVAGCLV